MGLSREKRLAFYATTYNHTDRDVDIFKTITLHEMATIPEYDFDQLTREVDNEMDGMVFAAG